MTLCVCACSVYVRISKQNKTSWQLGGLESIYCCFCQKLDRSHHASNRTEQTEQTRIEKDKKSEAKGGKKGKAFLSF